jgi:hypothetical protein
LALNLYQVLYWKSAMFPYLTPLIFMTWMLAFFFKIFREKNQSVSAGIGLGLLCILAGGFSETAALWQFGIWGFLFILCYFYRRDNFVPIKILAFPIAGSLVAILIMAMSPANASQLATFKRPDLVGLIYYSLIYAFDFIRTTLSGMILPFLIVGCFGGLFAFHTSTIVKSNLKSLLIKIVLIVLFCYFSCVAVTLPTMLAMSAYPGDRALFPALFTLVITVFLLGWLVTGYVLSLDIPMVRTGAGVLAIGVGVFLLFYLVRTAPRVYSDLSASQHRAEAWDVRHLSIIAAKNKGDKQIIVPAFDSIAQILELYPQGGFWVNSCAARYYGVEGISAVEGYNGVSPIFK